MMRANLAIGAALLVTLSTVGAAPSKKDVVKIEVRELGKRSADAVAAVGLSINGNAYRSELLLNNSASSIFTPGFRYIVGKEDVQGRTYFLDDTPPPSELRQIEKNFFVDPHTISALSIQKGEEGSLRIHGVTDNLALLPSQGDHHEIRELKRHDSQSEQLKDYIDLGYGLDPSPTQTFSGQPGAAVSAEPEVWIVFDYANSEVFGFSRTKILDYLGVMFHAINNLYSSVADPKIRFRISGVTSMTARWLQPFLERNKLPAGGGYDHEMTLSNFSAWASKQLLAPAFDVVALITGEEMAIRQNQTYNKKSIGLAVIGLTCKREPGTVYGVSATEDFGGMYTSVFAMAHELAHNLGAPHDGDEARRTTDCPWSDGYMMSYEGWGTKNHLTLSPCSIQFIKNNIASENGRCLTSRQSLFEVPLSADDIGDRMTMTQLCVKHMAMPDAIPDRSKTPDEQCRMLYCQVPDPSGDTEVIKQNFEAVPGDDVDCGTEGGRCKAGDCILPN